MSFLSSILSILTGGSATWSLAGDEEASGEEVGVVCKDCILGTGEEGREGGEEGRGEEGGGILEVA